MDVGAGRSIVQAIRRMFTLALESRIMAITDKPLADLLTSGWWKLLLRGLIAIAFGVYTFTNPAMAITTLVLIFGFYALLDGVLAVWAAFAGKSENEQWWVVLIGGLLGIGLGVFTFMAPGITALSLLFIIAIWAVGTGVLEIVAGVRLRKEIDNEWLLVLTGIVSVLFGGALIWSPGAGALSVLWMIGTFALIFGVLFVILSFKVKGLRNQAAR
jgi:uncharacterized membrane protein HdeD (DUF308 family)